MGLEIGQKHRPNPSTISLMYVQSHPEKEFSLVWGLGMSPQDIISNQFVYNILQIHMELHVMEGSHELKHRGFPSELVSPPQEHLMMLFHQIAGILVFANLNVIVLMSDKSHQHLPVTFWNLMSEFINDPIGV